MSIMAVSDFLRPHKARVERDFGMLMYPDQCPGKVSIDPHNMHGVKLQHHATRYDRTSAYSVSL